MQNQLVCTIALAFVAACSDSSFEQAGGNPGAGGGEAVGAGQSGGSNAGGSSDGGSSDGGSVSFDADYPMPPGVGSGVAVFVSPEGDDANDGLSLAAPKRTIGAAFDVAEPRSIISARGGSYGGFVVQDGDFGSEMQWI